MYVCVWVGVFDNSEYVRLNEFHVSLVTVCADILVIQRLISSQQLSRHDRPPEGGCIVVVVVFFFFFFFYVHVVIVRKSSMDMQCPDVLYVKHTLIPYNHFLIAS